MCNKLDAEDYTPEIQRKHRKLIKTADELDYDTALSGSEKEMEKIPRETMAGANGDRMIGVAGGIALNEAGDRNAVEMGDASIEDTELSLTHPISDDGDANGDVMMMDADHEDENSIELNAHGNTRERSPVKMATEPRQPPRGRPKMAFKPMIERAKIRCNKNKDDFATDDGTHKGGDQSQ